MRVPFFAKELVISRERVEFIKNSRKGSSGLFAGALFWLLAVVLSLFVSRSAAVNFYIFGGILIVPLGSTMILKLMGGKVVKNQYNSLVIISNMLFAYLYPLIIIAGRYNLNYIPAVVAIINGAHLLIFMWIHYEMLYLIIAGVYLGVSCLFIFIYPDYAYYGPGIVYVFVNIISGYLVYRSTDNPFKGYNYKIKD